jgi:hypothetical protein
MRFTKGNRCFSNFEKVQGKGEMCLSKLEICIDYHPVVGYGHLGISCQFCIF